MMTTAKPEITLDWLHKQEACSGGIDWWSKNPETDGISLVKKLIVDDKLSWANWLIVRIMTEY